MNNTVLKVEELEDYIGSKNGKYLKKRADVYACNVEKGLKDPKKERIGYIKAEPVINQSGELVTEIWYYRGYYKDRTIPNYFSSMRTLMMHLQGIHEEKTSIPEYTKAKEYVSLDTEED